jgi:hypothetical protein
MYEDCRFDGKWYVRGHDMSAPWMDADRVRHYHRPTVREILRDFLAEAEDAMRKGYDGIPDEIYDEYDQRLREAVRHED